MLFASEVTEKYPLANYKLWVYIILFFGVILALKCSMRTGPVTNHESQPETMPEIAVAEGLFYTDRQGNIFTISDDHAASTRDNRYPDYLYFERGDEDAARIARQLEKDDKDLPSYEEVMGISRNAAAAQAATNAPPPIAPGSINLDIIRTPAPPYPGLAATIVDERSGPANSSSMAAATTTLTQLDMTTTALERAVDPGASSGSSARNAPVIAATAAASSSTTNPAVMPSTSRSALRDSTV